MAQKKDRSRFSIKFRENDPAHERTICILESQGQRNIAPFLVNAVLHYVQCSETPDMSHMLTNHSMPMVDKYAIEEIVWGILRQQGIVKCEVKSKVTDKTEANFLEENKDLDIEEDTPVEGISPQNMVNDEMRAMITRTLSVFRRDFC